MFLNSYIKGSKLSDAHGSCLKLIRTSEGLHIEPGSTTQRMAAMVGSTFIVYF